MDALTSILDSLAWPEFPSTPGAQAAFIGAAAAILIGLLILIFPVSAGRLFRLASRESRPGAIGELRAAGGFLLGLALAALMFDQPPFYTALGLAFAVSAFARILSLMSDRSASLVNVLLLLLQVVLAGALLYYFFDTVTPDMHFSLPEDRQAALAFYTYVAIAAIGAIMMFAPRITSWIVGLDGLTDAGFSSIRAAGGFALGASILAILLVGDPGARETPFAKLLYVNLGFALALALAVVGRLIALALNRGNYIYAIVALAAETAAAVVVITYMIAIMQ